MDFSNSPFSHSITNNTCQGFSVPLTNPPLLQGAAPLRRLISVQPAQATTALRFSIPLANHTIHDANYSFITEAGLSIESIQPPRALSQDGELVVVVNPSSLDNDTFAIRELTIGSQGRNTTVPIVVNFRPPSTDTSDVSFTSVKASGLKRRAKISINYCLRNEGDNSVKSKAILRLSGKAPGQERKRNITLGRQGFLIPPDREQCLILQVRRSRVPAIQGELLLVLSGGKRRKVASLRPLTQSIQ